MSSRIPFPAAGREQATLDALEALCRREKPAAFIVEPLVLGAGGMLMYPARVLAEMKRICAAHDVLFIADEVMTGWGRTGTLFACEQAGIAPDIACYSKGLTGGSLPLAVTLCRAEIFAAHYSNDRRRTFFHSSSYTANPIACAAALANLEIWRTEPVAERIANLAAMQEARLRRFDGRSAVRESAPDRHDRGAGSRRSATKAISPISARGLLALLSDPRSGFASARQYDLCPAALLRHRRPISIGSMVRSPKPPIY